MEDKAPYEYPLYDNMTYKRYKAMVDAPLLNDIYDKLQAMEKEIVQLRLDVVMIIDRLTDDGR